MARWLESPMELPDPALLLAMVGEPAQRAAPAPSPAELSEPSQPAPTEVPAVSAPGEALSAVPIPQAPADRMLINTAGFDMVAFRGVGGDWRGELPQMHTPVAPRLEGPWRESHGLRFRINYLKPEGFFKVDGTDEIEVTIPQGSRRYPVAQHVKLPPQYWRTYAIYHGGDVVDYEIELENTSDRTLENLLVFSSQESFNLMGRMGKMLGPVELFKVKTLPPGGHVWLSAKMTIAGYETAGGNFEQSHLSVYTEGENGRQNVVDDPQANIVDPPR
jgi:hypothetical protein